MAENPSESPRKRLAETTVSLPLATLIALLPTGAAGGASYFAGDRAAGELREFRVEVRAQLDSLQRDLTRYEVSNRDLEGRIRALELRDAANRGTAPPR